MSVFRKFNPADLKFEYGLDCIRLLPWKNLNAPFGGAYCVVKSGTVSLDHVNEPNDEEELFICIEGSAKVHVGNEIYEAAQGDMLLMPRGVNHYVNNDSDGDFHYYALWWNKPGVDKYLENYVEVEQ